MSKMKLKEKLQSIVKWKEMKIQHMRICEMLLKQKEKLLVLNGHIRIRKVSD